MNIIPPVIPPEIESNLEKEMAVTFGFQHEGDYTVSLEFAEEKSAQYDRAYSLIINHDHRQKIKRHGLNCHYVTYNLKQLKEMLDLYQAIRPLKYSEMYINHRKLPYTHSLWVQLFQLMS